MIPRIPSPGWVAACIAATLLSPCLAQTGAPSGSVAADTNVPPDVRTQIEGLHSKNPVARGEAAGKLLTMGPKAAAAAPYLVEMLGDPAPLGFSKMDRDGKISTVGRTTVGEIAANTLRAVKSEAVVEPLIHGLTNADAEVRQNAAHALGAYPDARTLMPLLAAAKDTNCDVRAKASLSLGTRKDPRILDAMLITVKDPSEKVRKCAAAVLGLYRDRRSVESLIAALKDGDPDVRCAAAVALGNIRDMDTVEPLKVALSDNAETVRRAATAALQQIEAKKRALAPTDRWQTWQDNHLDDMSKKR